MSATYSELSYNISTMVWLYNNIGTIVRGDVPSSIPTFMTKEKSKRIPNIGIILIPCLWMKMKILLKICYKTIIDKVFLNL